MHAQLFIDVLIMFMSIVIVIEVMIRVYKIKNLLVEKMWCKQRSVFDESSIRTIFFFQPFFKSYSGHGVLLPIPDLYYNTFQDITFYLFGTINLDFDVITSHNLSINNFILCIEE